MGVLLSHSAKSGLLGKYLLSNKIMYPIKLYLLFFLVSITGLATAQNFPDIESLLESNNIENTEDAYEEMVNTLMRLSISPLNINTADFDSLKMLFLLSDSQIDQLLIFRTRYGPFLHPTELLWVPGFSRKDVENIVPFITLGQITPRDKYKIIHTRTKQELLAKVQMNLPRQEGYKIYLPDEFEKKKEYEKKAATRFHGPPFGTLIKYKISVSNHLQAGLTLENDAGENYFTRYQNTGFDFLSAHLSMSSEHFFRKIILGDFRIQWGQGLVAWGGFASGKSDVAVGNEKAGKGIAPYTSTDENNYLRGIALSVSPLQNLSLDFFFSNKKTDGNITPSDTLAEEDLLTVSLYESGYHRNDNECRKKHKLKEMTTGFSCKWNTAYFKISVNGIYYNFSPALIPGDRIYQQYNETGKDRSLFSLDYKTAWQGIYLFGETAISEAGAFATLHGLRWSSSLLSTCLLYRRYDKRYISRYAAGFGEYSNTSNEEGIYAGLDLTPVRNLKLNLYYDWFRFFSARYGATLPGDGWELLSEITYHHTKFSHQIRYKHEVRPEDIKGGKSVQRGKNEYRYQFNYTYSKQLEFRTRLSMSQYHKDILHEKGYLVYQDIIHSNRQANFKIQYRLAWFKTDSYQSRIYAYENNVLYGYSFPSFMGEGWRSYVNLSWKPMRQLTCYLKTGVIVYPHQEAISSGVTKIEDNKLFDFTLQIRLVF